MDYLDNKQRFISLFNEYVTHDGKEKLLDYIENNTDFFTAPASTRFHLCVEGGLVEHSLNVYARLLGFVKAEYGENFENVIPMRSIAICALLHDICKANTYKVDYRNVKVDNVWERQPFYATDDQLPYGHGEKSVYIINGYVRLSREEAMAINWHMGGFDDRVKGGGSSCIANAFSKYPLAVFLHMADFLATYIDEK